jgi:hypothetical protein
MYVHAVAYSSYVGNHMNSAFLAQYRLCCALCSLSVFLCHKRAVSLVWAYTVRLGIGQDRFGNALGVGLRIGLKTGEAGIFFNGRGGKRAVLWIENW